MSLIFYHEEHEGLEDTMFSIYTHHRTSNFGINAWRRRGVRSIFAPRQLLSYMDVMNAENAGAFF
ncbi:MAG TPA: hypothetical protein DCZ48_16020, partial [Methylococcaceae bacterium]|nr:hypothetical protein [Methylococcaceae bacterium]